MLGPTTYSAHSAGQREQSDPRPVPNTSPMLANVRLLPQFSQVTVSKLHASGELRQMSVI